MKASYLFKRIMSVTYKGKDTIQLDTAGSSECSISALWCTPALFGLNQESLQSEFNRLYVALYNSNKG